MINYTVRPVAEKDNEHVANIIRTVMPEFGASGAGFAIHDKEVDNIYSAYTRPRTAFFVCEREGQIIGGGGIAPLEGGNDDTCELKKMYFLPHGRGKGLGQEVLRHCIDAAREMGFAFCYLETFNTMKGAMKLYEKNGFERIAGQMGNTGHFACDIFYRMKL